MTTKFHRANFITPEQFELIKRRKLAGPNGWLLFVACNSGTGFADAVRNEYESMLTEQQSALKKIPLMGTAAEPITRIFSDTETCPRLPAHVAGSDAYVFQCVQENISGNTVNENIQQLLQVVRTLRAHRARTITVVTPYSPYSRQDKPSFMQREAALACLFADQLKVAGADIYVTYHPHTYSLFGYYEPAMKFVALSGMDLFVRMFAHLKNRDQLVAVSTDSGGAKFTVHYSEAMGIAHAIASKFRRGKDQAHLLGIIGDFEGKTTAIVTDDETVTGSSIINTVKSLYSNHGIREIYAAVTHLKVKKEYLPQLVEAHEQFGLKELHVTDTIPQIPELLNLDFVVMHPLAGIFAATINRLHYNQSISEVFSEHLKTPSA